VCKIPSGKLTKQVLRSKPKTLKTIGDKKSSTPTAKGKKQKKKKPKSKPSDDEDSRA
jgi:hypothetical protein